MRPARSFVLPVGECSHVAEWAMNQRKRLGLTVERLAALSGVSEPTTLRIERGYPARTLCLARLVRVLADTPDSMLGFSRALLEDGR